MLRKIPTILRLKLQSSSSSTPKPIIAHVSQASAFVSASPPATSKFTQTITAFRLISNTTSNFVSMKGSRSNRWERMLQELIEYRERYGDTMVPSEYALNPQLGTWVDTQRQNYKYYIQGRKSFLTDQRIDVLEKEGFVWDVHELGWDKRFQELTQYKEKHGNTNVPQTEEYYELWSWVFVQRRSYSQRTAGNPSSMTEQRMEALESLGFIWNAHEEAWNQKFAELKEYRRNHGDCLIPKDFPSNPALSKWVEMQRSQYKYLNSGKRSHLTPARKWHLDEIGFVWNVHEMKWNMKLEEMKEFFVFNGHLRVPPKANKSLSYWLRRQRTEYTKFANGDKSVLTEERITSLREAGFGL